MNTQNLTETNPAIPAARVLHTMVRVGNLERSLAFYIDALGMRELRREDYSEGRFTLVFVGYSDETSSTVIELTCNWDTASYNHGAGYGHIAIGVPDIYSAIERLASMSVKITRPPGPMAFTTDATNAPDVIAFIEDPDGYQIELIEKA